MPQLPFTVDARLTGIALAFTNPALIADLVFPRINVPGRLYSWLEYDLAEGLTIPDTLVGRKGRPNEVEFTAKERQSAVVDYGLDDLVPQDDIDTAAAGNRPSPMLQATEGVMSLVLLDRERRVSELVFNPDTYSAANTETMAAADQWSDPASDPIGQICDTLDDMLVRPNIAVLGSRVWSVLRRHPAIISAVNKNSGEKGIATKQEVADLFELDDIIVGRARYNSARKGQTAVLGRIWGPSAAFLYRDMSIKSTTGGVTFGITAQWGNRVGGTVQDGSIGLKGGVRVRAGEQVNELVLAKDAGFLFVNPVG